MLIVTPKQPEQVQFGILISNIIILTKAQRTA